MSVIVSLQKGGFMAFQEGTTKEDFILILERLISDIKEDKIKILEIFDQGEYQNPLSGGYQIIFQYEKGDI